MHEQTHEKVQRITGVALLMALVVVLQLLGSFIRFGPFSISLVLVPIALGAALYGIGAGAWLGFVFGVTVLLSGDAAAFLSVTVVGTVVTVLTKGVCAGLAAGSVYRLAARKNDTLGAALAAVAAPIVNTGVFLLGCLAFFMPTLRGWAEGMGFGENVFGYMLLGLVGGNFLFELGANLILCPVIVRLIRMRKKA